jgi:hypothetical protein
MFCIFANVNDKMKANMATDKTAYWLDIADYDLDTAEAMHQTGRYPEDKEELARTLTPQACRQIIDETKQMQQWIKEHLPETRPSNLSADINES